jgi:hypothetical protein
MLAATCDFGRALRKGSLAATHYRLQFGHLRLGIERASWLRVTGDVGAALEGVEALTVVSGAEMPTLPLAVSGPAH